MRTHRIVVAPPVFDYDLRLLQCVEEFSVQQLITQFAVEALAIAVLPRTSGFDVSRPGADGSYPLAKSQGDESGPLSERMCEGTPREIYSSQSDSMTSVALSFRATRMARLSRLNSSMMHSIRNALPS